MRSSFALVVLACAGTPALAPLPAHAQASIDPRALDQLQTPQATPASPEPAKPGSAARPDQARPPSRAGTTTGTQPPAHPNAAANGAHPPTPAKPAAPPAPAPPQVRVPLAPPPPPMLPPPLVVPTRPPAPPTPAPVAADAPGAAVQIPDGLRVTFGESRADLNPATETALRSLAHAAPGDAAFTVAAFAPGAPEDPSTPRRLSLSRALTVRSVLIAEGIASVRIYVKALGPGPGLADGPADRVDVTVAATNPQARSP